jgi:hypothetical protein
VVPGAVSGASTVGRTSNKLERKAGAHDAPEDWLNRRRSALP